MSISQEELTKFFKEIGGVVSQKEQEALAKEAKKTKLADWKNRHNSMIVLSGAAAGLIPGGLGLLALPADLLWCGKVSANACFGVGHILGKEVDYDFDMAPITAIWTDQAYGARDIPEGKVGIEVPVAQTLMGKAGAKIGGKVAGKVLQKATVKGSAKIAAKLSHKASTKGAAKLVAKLGPKLALGWVPLLGAGLSAGVNYWLVDGLMEAAIQYYANPYVLFYEKNWIDSSDA
ncbi:MAG: hypothetical protein AB4372_39680 [Xenococcus sp. (in: cyanobacteria)]